MIPIRMCVGTSAALAFVAGSAIAQSHEAVVIVNPDNAESLRIANHYANARDVPVTNMVTFDPSAPNFFELNRVNHAALLGMIANQGITDPDYVLLTPDAPFFTTVPSSLISDGCSPLRRISLASAYTLTLSADEITAGTGIALPNRYAATSLFPESFDSDFAYLNGMPSTGSFARRYFLGAALGYTGERGNTVDEILNMIESSAAADGTSPDGEFVFVETNDASRSGPRENLFPAAVNAITAQGEQAVEIMGVLPVGGRVCTGLMTGAATPNIETGNFSLTPGSFADHLTSFSGAFDIADQTKMSRWITKGATATAGAVEEPCNYAGKFPAPRLHSYVARGSTLGEAFYRSVSFTPLQIMFMGDPLCRPFATLPQVDDVSLPTTASCELTFTPAATTTSPEASIASLSVYAEGTLLQTSLPGEAITLNLTSLPDGPNNIRTVATDDSLAGVTGQSTRSLVVNNHNFVVDVTPSSTGGDLSTVFEFDVQTVGAVEQVLLVSGSRVVAASADTAQPLRVRGHALGQGPARVHVLVEYADGKQARSETIQLSVGPGSSTATTSPVAHSFTKRIAPGQAFVVELPALTSSEPGQASYTIVTEPTQATALIGSGFHDSGSYRIYEPLDSASGTDTLVFEVTDAGGTSQGTITLVYAAPPAPSCSPRCPADVNNDGSVTPADFTAWLAFFQNPTNTGAQRADINRDAEITPADFTAWLGAFSDPCP